MLQRRCAASRLLILLAGLVFSVPLFAASIDPVNKYAWAENAGWINWRDTVNNYGSAQVFADHLEGYVWAENIGWIRLGSFSGGGTHPYANTTAVNYGVNRAGTNLSGYAWSEAAGWVNFAPTGGGVTIDATTGQFDGYAWSENVGWIHLRNASPAYNVAILTGGAVTLTSSLNPSTVSQSVTFTATVAGTPTPTGTVDFTADSVAITGCTANALTSGATTCTTADLSVGSHAIAAVYSGDGNYPSATGTLTQTVEAPTTVNPTGPGYGSTPAPEQTLNLGLISVGAYGTGNLLIRNTGDARLDISTLTLSGPNAGDFRVDPTSLSIHNGGPAQTLLLTCTPTATGYRTATLTVTHNATIGNPAHYPLACTGVAETAQLTVSTTGLGAVTSSPSGITCGSDCTERYAPDTIVTLTATPSRSRHPQPKHHLPRLERRLRGRSGGLHGHDEHGQDRHRRLQRHRAAPHHPWSPASWSMVSGSQRQPGLGRVRRGFLPQLWSNRRPAHGRALGRRQPEPDRSVPPRYRPRLPRP